MGSAVYKKMHIKSSSKDLEIQLMLDSEAGVLAGAWTALDGYLSVVDGCLSVAVNGYAAVDGGRN